MAGGECLHLHTLCACCGQSTGISSAGCITSMGGLDRVVILRRSIPDAPGVVPATHVFLHIWILPGAATVSVTSICDRNSSVTRHNRDVQENTVGRCTIRDNKNCPCGV